MGDALRGKSYPYAMAAFAAGVCSLVWAARGRPEISALVSLQVPLWLIVDALRRERRI